MNIEQVRVRSMFEKWCLSLFDVRTNQGTLAFIFHEKSMPHKLSQIAYVYFSQRALFSKFPDFALSSLYGSRVICGFFEILISFLIFTFFTELNLWPEFTKAGAGSSSFFYLFTNICHLSTNQRTKKGLFNWNVLLLYVFSFILICFSCLHV